MTTRTLPMDTTERCDLCTVPATQTDGWNYRCAGHPLAPSWRRRPIILSVGIARLWMPPVLDSLCYTPRTGG